MCCDLCIYIYIHNMPTQDYIWLLCNWWSSKLPWSCADEWRRTFTSKAPVEFFIHCIVMKLLFFSRFFDMLPMDFITQRSTVEQTLQGPQPGQWRWPSSWGCEQVPRDQGGQISWDGTNGWFINIRRKGWFWGVMMILWWFDSDLIVMFNDLMVIINGNFIVNYGDFMLSCIGDRYGDVDGEYKKEQFNQHTWIFHGDISWCIKIWRGLIHFFKICGDSNRDFSIISMRI